MHKTVTEITSRYKVVTVSSHNRKQRNETAELPILCPWTEGTHDGYANFDDPELPVKVVTVDALNPDTREAKEFRHLLSKKEWDFIASVRKLKLGFKRQAPQTIREQYAALHDEIFEESEQSDEAIARNIALGDWLADRPISVVALLPGILSNALRGVRLVLWWWDKQTRFTPALFCPTAGSAALAWVTLGFVGHNLRICPRCSRMFATRRSDQECCTTKCGNAWRQERRRREKAA